VPELVQVARHSAVRTRSPVRFAAEVEACNMTPPVRARSPVRLQAVQVMASMDQGVRPENAAYSTESSWNSELPSSALQLLKESIHREMQAKITNTLEAHLKIINSQLASLGEKLVGEDMQGMQ